MSRLVTLLVLLGFCAIISSASNKSDRKQFQRFVKQYNRAYVDDSEYELRFKYFQESIQRIEQKQKKDKHATYGINQFSDFSREEFARRLSPSVVSPKELAVSCLANGAEAVHMDVDDIPASWDWRTKGVVTPVKNQGDCGSCWAFSTTGDIESQWALKGNTLTQFSEQLLVDCSHGCCEELNQSVCNSGCEGGWQWNAYTDIESWGGIALESAYPYTGVDGTCRKNSTKLMAPITNYTCLSVPNAADEDQMAAYLVAHGPLAVALNAELVEDYSSGIIDPYFPGEECDPTQLDHAVLIVGYGSESSWFGSTPFWIVKNSWGSEFGENGYFRIYRGDGCCGINQAVSSVNM